MTSFEYKFASHRFYKGIQKICSENGISFIVNEGMTSLGITGKMWGHENWFLDESPDIVTFGGRT